MAAPADPRQDAPAAAPHGKQPAEPEAFPAERPFIRDGIAARVMDGFTGGAILTGLALLLGAEEWHVGLVAALPFIAQLLQLPAVILLERVPDRRRVCLAGSGLSRVLLLALGLLPVLRGPGAGIELMLALFGALSVAGAVSTASWNTWLREILPPRSMGAIFARRLAAQAGAGAVVAIVAGAMLDAVGSVGGGPLGFALLYAAGAGAGFVGLVFMARMPNPSPRPREPPRGVVAVLARPFGDRNFRRLMVFNAAWGFSVNLAAPFITLFLLLRLGLPFVVIGVFAALATLASVASLPAWGRVSDRFGNKPVLAIGAPVISLTLLLWVFFVRDASMASLVVVGAIHVLNGWANAGVDLASNNILLKLAPDRDAAAYLASASITRAAASALGPIVGAILAAWFAPRSLTFAITWTDPVGDLVLTPVRMIHYDFLFLFATLAGLYAVHRLASVVEAGEAGPEEVLRALRSEVATANTFLGLRRFANVGSAAAYLVRSMAALPAPRRREPEPRAARHGGPRGR